MSTPEEQAANDLNAITETLEEAIKAVPRTGAKVKDRLALTRAHERALVEAGSEDDHHWRILNNPMLDTGRQPLKRAVLKFSKVEKQARDLLNRFEEAV